MCSGQQTLFATSSAIGLDTALGVLSAGLVVVGNLPVTSAGAVPGQGSLQFFNRNGNLVAPPVTDATLLNGPWDLTINDNGSTAQIFVSNALSGTVTRLNVAVSSSSVTVLSKVQIGSGFTHMLFSPVVVLAPTGLAYDPSRDMLFVASTADNEIFGISNAGARMTDAGKGAVVFADPTNLHGSLGLTLIPNCHRITANGDAVCAIGTQNELVEFTEQGGLVATYQLDPGAAGAAFGVTATSSHGSVRFAAVDDDLNAVIVWTLRAPLAGDQ
jgi:DNA-binding beta-propeller fold protein YncE